MRNDDRLYRNPMGRDPAHIVEGNEPQRGYTGDSHRFYAPSPVAAKLMEECVNFALFWLNDFEHAVERRTRRIDAVRRQAMNRARCRELNIQMLREYLTSLRGEKKMRAYRTIANLESQQAAS